MSEPLTKLQAEREGLLQNLATTGDMRRGSITEVYRSCGKPTCACASADHPGHGISPCASASASEQQVPWLGCRFDSVVRGQNREGGIEVAS
jgi:hypothetical protein